MKQKQVLLSVVLLCLGLMGVVSCGPPRLPRATDLYFNENAVYINKGNGSYLQQVDQQEIAEAFGSTLSDELKGSLVNVQVGSFSNTPFRLEINQFRLKEGWGCSIDSDTCTTYFTRVKKVRLDLKVTLYKAGTKLKSWKLCAKSKESTRKISTHFNDGCPGYEVVPNSIDIPLLVKSCARKAKRKVVRKMKRNL